MSICHCPYLERESVCLSVWLPLVSKQWQTLMQKWQVRKVFNLFLNSIVEGGGCYDIAVWFGVGGGGERLKGICSH